MTTAPAAKQRMRDLIAAAVTTAQVTYGAPTRMAQVPETTDRAMIYLRPPLNGPQSPSVDDGDGEWAALGNRRRREEYTVALTADVFYTGDDEQAAETRAAELLLEAQNALVADPLLGGLLEHGVTFEQASLDDAPTEQPEGWRAWATCRVRCQAVVLTS